MTPIISLRRLAVVAVGLLGLSVCACGGSATPGSPTPTTPVQPPATPASCSASLWNRVHDPSRLRVVQDCVTVTGVVTDYHSNDDGDIDIRVDVDAPYKNLLNDQNVAQLNGHLQTEAICQVPATLASAVQSCAGFTGTVVVPAVGTHVRVTGVYVLDTGHGWMEIHPISALVVG